MKLTGRLILGNKTKNQSIFKTYDSEKSFRDLLEEGLIYMCKELDVSVPIWLDRNTRELSLYRKTHFTIDQFVEKVNFDRFDISLDKS